MGSRTGASDRRIYFRFDGLITRIAELHMPFIHAIRHRLEPIEIIPTELFMLNFSSVRETKYGEFEKFTAEGDRLWLRHGDYGWRVSLDIGLTKTEIKYVHQLQRIWFAHTEELLRRKGD